MKNRLLLFYFNRIMWSCIMVMIVSLTQAQQLAFPGAEGFGRYTTGGRGGAVYEVTNLNDDNLPGSFRYAVTRSGPRTVVFRVSGTITLNSDLEIKNGNLTIAGQTAPGDGICIKDYQVKLDADNIIVRYIRFRVGNTHVATTEPDAFQGQNRENIIIDHCSMSWSVDEAASFYDNKNFTMQWCIISESLYAAGHSKGAHGYGGIQGGMGATFHHNIYASNTSRNPRFCGARYHQATANTEIVDFRNNVLFNWGSQSVYGGEFGQQNVVNNYYKAGPATTSSDRKNRIALIDRDAETDPGKWYIEGNYVEGYPATTADNWTGVYGADKNTAGVKMLSPFTFASVTTQTPQDAYTSVLASAGASFPTRDAVDARIINEIQTGVCAYGGLYAGNLAGSGIIDNPSTVGGWPTLNSTTPPIDTDQDGMPDSWEITHGYIPTFAGDRNAVGADGYTALEKYLNCLLEATCPVRPTYTLTVNSGTGTGNITVTPNSNGIYAEGTEVTLTATPGTDNIFKDWTGDATGTTSSITVVMSGNKNVTGNFQSSVGMIFHLKTAVIGSGSVTFSPDSTGGYVSGTVVTVTAVPGSGYNFLNWSGDLSGSATSTTITMTNDKSINASFASIIKKRVAYVTDALSPFYTLDNQILPALKADSRFEVTEINARLATNNYSPYDVVIFSEVPASTAAGVAQLEGLYKPFLMMKVHSYKAGTGAWNWITPVTGYGQNDVETNIVVSDIGHPIFSGVTFVNGNEVQILSSVTAAKGLTYMNPADVTSVTGGAISTIATVKNNATQSCIVQIPAGTTVSGTLLQQPFIQVGINSNSYDKVTTDGVKIILNATYYLAEQNTSPTGIRSIKELSNVKCYPSMVNDLMTIDFSNAKGGTTQIDIISLTGTLVRSYEKEVTAGQSLELNLSDLHPGLYICKIQNAEGMANYKVVKK